MRKTYAKSCPTCKTEFTTTRESKKFCCFDCCLKPGARSPRSPNGSGGIGPFGYRYIRRSGIRMLEHRAIMEDHLGRSLTKKEVVHHKDRNKLNNSIENLELLKSQSEHASLHIKRFADETRKECSRCFVIKDRSEFRKRSRGHNKDPHQAYCRQCCAEDFKERRAKAGPCSLCGEGVGAYGGKCSKCTARIYRERHSKNLTPPVRSRQAATY